MKKVYLFVVFVLFVSITTPAISGLLFYDDCEDYPKTSDWGLTESSGKLTVSADQKRDGSKSYKFDFAATDTNVGKRVELVLRADPLQNWDFGNEYWFGYSIYIPSNFVLPTGYGVIVQFHKAGQDIDNECDQAPRPEYPAVAQPFMNFTSGTDLQPKMKIQITGQSQYCQPYSYDYRESFYSAAFKKGAWNDIVIHTIFEYNKKGVTQMWLNGTKVIDIEEINAHNDPKPPYMKMGFYASSSKAHTVYYDEIRVGGANSSYDEVAPRGSASASSDDNSTTTEIEAPYLTIRQTN